MSTNSTQTSPNLDLNNSKQENLAANANSLNPNFTAQSKFAPDSLVNLGQEAQEAQETQDPGPNGSHDLGQNSPKANDFDHHKIQPLGRSKSVKLAESDRESLDVKPASAQSKSTSGFGSFVKGLLLGSENEQKADFSPLQAVLSYVRNRFTGQKAKTLGGAGNDLGRNMSLFAAMDAPLNGLRADDLIYANEVDAALARRPRFGARFLSLAVAAMFVVLIAWAAWANIDEITHAEGSVVGSRRTQTIQNLEGGILRSILVHEGQVVEKNMVLAQLDNESAESSYRDAVNKTLENTLAICRLEAEQAEVEPDFPKDLKLWVANVIGQEPKQQTLERAEQIVWDQRKAWQSRKLQLKSDLAVLKSQYEQRVHEVDEEIAKKTQLERSLVLAKRQRDTALNLVRHNNYSKLDYLGLEQKVVDLQGQINQLSASIPKAQAAAKESQQRMTSHTAEFKAEISAEINKRRIELTSLRETLVSGGDRVTRTELKSPVRGTVKQIYINSVGGVVKPGESIMDVVPLDDTLLVEAKVLPRDVAFLHPGQSAMVKVSAYDFNIYGGLEGKLESISADTIEDKRGEYFYIVKIRTPKTNIVYHKEILPIIPGMLVTADILIGKKTVLDYLLKPILKAKQNALRER